MLTGRTRAHSVLAFLAAAACCPGCGAAGGGDTSEEVTRPAPDAAEVTDSAGDLSLPPVDGGLDYQLGEAYAPPAGVSIVVRDRTAPIAPGLYNVCYVNGFQIQPGEESLWLGEHPDLVLRDGDGQPVIDPDWDELLLDVSTPAKRAQIAEIVGDWIEGCANDGFAAVEIDNLDTFARFPAFLAEDDAVAMMALFSARAHARGLAIAQKNAAEIAHRKAEMGTDLVVSEECNRYDECDVFTGVYGAHVLVIEYRRQDFERGCADYPGLPIVLRDLDLVGPTSSAYVYDGC